MQTALEKKLNNSPLESSCGHNAGVIWKNRYFLPKISEMIKKYNIWRMVVAISWSNQWDWMYWNFLPEFCFFSPHHSPSSSDIPLSCKKKKKNWKYQLRLCDMRQHLHFLWIWALQFWKKKQKTKLNPSGILSELCNSLELNPSGILVALSFGTASWCIFAFLSFPGRTWAGFELLVFYVFCVSIFTLFTFSHQHQGEELPVEI